MDGPHMTLQVVALAEATKTYFALERFIHAKSRQTVPIVIFGRLNMHPHEQLIPSG